MKYLFGLLAVFVALVTGGRGEWTADASVGDPPAGSTIVDVDGDRDHGFVIRHYDGTVDYPPTLSEAVAECGEYARRRERLRCRTAQRVWYRDLGQLKRALDHAHTAG